MSALAILGCATIAAFLLLVAFTRTPVIAALVLTPVVAAVAGGLSSQLGSFAVDGLKTVAPVASLMMFAVLYFGLMIDVGLFAPLVERLIGVVRGDPIRLCLATAALAMLVALDGDGATTFLISITALLPVHRRLDMNPLVLPAIVGLAAGVMNLLPWGGPTARAMSVLRSGVDQIFVPVLPAMGAGILNGSGMIRAMATRLASNTPHTLSPWLSQMVAISSMPLSLVFTPDAYYFGVLPVFAEAAASVGRDPLTIGRAAILGQMTTGFPLSPLTASTFILLGLSGVSLREHQRFVFKWAFGTTVVMTIVASITGAI